MFSWIKPLLIFQRIYIQLFGLFVLASGSVGSCLWAFVVIFYPHVRTFFFFSAFRERGREREKQ